MMLVKSSIITFLSQPRNLERLQSHVKAMLSVYSRTLNNLYNLFSLFNHFFKPRLKHHTTMDGTFERGETFSRIYGRWAVMPDS